MAFDIPDSAELRAALADAGTMRRIRTALHDTHPGSASWDDMRVLRVYFAERERWPGLLSTGSKNVPATGATPAPAPAPAAARSSSAAPYLEATATTIAPTPTPASTPVAKTWIEIQLLGEDDKPIPGEKYEITLSNGLVLSGYLNAEGLARVDGLDPDTCQISFPELDKDAWSPI
ncbi:hypothetical protein IGB42_03346 [Andreprevotia sp. IGB-42]|uniref:hypothetical protein n=1 Tax=Andreprevotia sp. IGB-42 TaxID=2497473 RepID=UPI00135AC74E|nr:hypothetical protein [Andreprevotia sp. IGB-42]KAF0812069.1 hypothetical protein IGB42_03346 [Andreprevotia sp. IGB-42]